MSTGSNMIVNVELKADNSVNQVEIADMGTGRFMEGDEFEVEHHPLDKYTPSLLDIEDDPDNITYEKGENYRTNQN